MVLNANEYNKTTKFSNMFINFKTPALINRRH